MRISDWSSDVCSSDLSHRGAGSEALEASVQHPPPAVLHDELVRHDAEDEVVGVAIPAAVGFVVRREPVPAGHVVPSRGAVAVHGEVEVRHAVDRSLERSEEPTSELQSLMRTSYAVSCLKKQTNN